jgi:hypothetical protein
MRLCLNLIQHDVHYANFWCASALLCARSDTTISPARLILLHFIFDAENALEFGDRHEPDGLWAGLVLGDGFFVFAAECFFLAEACHLFLAVAV